MMRGREITLPTKKELGYLVGLFAGDGYSIHDKNSRHYTVEFFLNSLRDIDIQTFLLKILSSMNLFPNITKDKRFNCNRIRVYSKLFFNLIVKKFVYSRDFKLGFVSGLIDSDGYYNKKKSHIEIVNTNKKLLLKAKRFLTSLRIDSTVRKRVKSRKDRLISYRLYISIKFIRLKNVSIKKVFTILLLPQTAANSASLEINISVSNAFLPHRASYKIPLGSPINQLFF